MAGKGKTMANALTTGTDRGTGFVLFHHFAQQGGATHW